MTAHVPHTPSTPHTPNTPYKVHDEPSDQPTTDRAVRRRAMRRLHQLCEIVALAEAGATGRTTDLIRLHLAEFPDDRRLVEPLDT